MDNIISTSEVIELAFSDGGYIPQGVICKADIKAATERWIEPVVGRALLEAVAAGEYELLKSDYLAPAVAVYTRILVQPRLNAMSGVGGMTVSGSTSRKAAEESVRKELMSGLKTKAKSLLRALSNYLNDNAEQIAEYDKKYNIMNRCVSDGGIVQIL